MKNFKRYSAVLVVAAIFALNGCGGSSDSDNSTAAPDDGIDYTTIGTDRAFVEYINSDENSFKITWYKDSTGSSNLALKYSKENTLFQRLFIPEVSIKPGIGEMECFLEASSANEAIFLCDVYWEEYGSERESYPGSQRIWLNSGDYAEIIAEYTLDKGGSINDIETYLGETFGTIEWSGTQLIVN